MLKIAIVRFGAFGDTLRNFQLVHCLRNVEQENQLKFHITFITKINYQELFLKEQNLDNLLLLKNNESFLNFRKRIKFENFDYVFDLHQSLRAKALFFNHPKVIKIQKNYNYLNKLFNKVFIPKYSHEELLSQVFFQFLKEEDINPKKEYPLDYFSPKNFNTDYKEFKKIKTVLLSPGSRWKTKIWPVKHYISLIHLLINKNIQVVVQGLESETHAFKNLNFKGVSIVEPSFGELKLLMDSVQLHISGDTGAFHLAKYMGVRNITLFGSTSPKQFQEGDDIFIFKQLECSPCSSFGKRKCPKTHFQCMQELTPLDVFEQIADFL